MNIKLILKLPSGISVYESAFATTVSNVCTACFNVSPQDGERHIELELIGNQIGRYDIETELYYSIEGEEEVITQTDNLSLFIESPITPLHQSNSPGFESCAIIIALMFVTYYLIKQRKYD